MPVKKKVAKKGTSAKKTINVESRLASIEKKLDLLAQNQGNILKVEKQVEIEEERELAKQTEEVDELKTLEKIEEKIEGEVKTHPLTRIGLRDFFKSIIGAFIGIMGHFSFFYGVEIAHNISMGRASVLYIVSFVIGLLYVYFAGFRKVKDLGLGKFVPVRVLTIYITSIIVIIGTLFLFGFFTSYTPFTEIFKTVSTISILAVLGAATADLIGGDKE